MQCLYMFQSTLQAHRTDYDPRLHVGGSRFALAAYVTHSDKRGTKSIWRSRDNWRKLRLGIFFSQYFGFDCFQIAGRLCYQFLTDHLPFRPVNVQVRRFSSHESQTTTFSLLLTNVTTCRCVYNGCLFVEQVTWSKDCVRSWIKNKNTQLVLL